MHRCPQCGLALADQADDGPCPACLLGQGDRGVAAGPVDPNAASSFAARPTEADARPSESAAPVIGHYKLLQKIGEGGFGSVFMAEQESPVRRRVALKIIKLGMDTRQVIARFEAERQALAMMDHPNIAKVLDAGATESGRPYFVMELVRGVPITEYCDANRLTTDQRLELLIKVCHAIQHAHQKGVIHRDIKPSNILVTLHDGVPVPKLIDFGIAKATQSRLTEKTLFTQFRQMIGTPAYMSPEQAEMSGLDVDTRSDIYSLGVLMYELLTGTTPFDPQQLSSHAHAELQRIIREVEPPKPSTRLSTLGALLPKVASNRATDPRRLSQFIRGELDWIVMKAMEKDRTRRYESAGEMARDITRHLNDEPVAACPPSAAYRLSKFFRRNRNIVSGAAAILVTLIAGTAFYIHSIRAEQRKTELALDEARNQRQESERRKVEADTQRDQAHEQERIAASVSQFLTNMLSSADPARLMGDKVTVVQAIEAATKHLDSGGAAIDPKIEASLRDTIGSTLLLLGRYAQAESSLRKSLAIRRQAAASPSEELGMTLRQLGQTLEAEYQPDEAMSLFTEALQMQRRLSPPNQPEIAANLQSIGVLLLQQDRPSEAEPMLDEALRIERRALPAGDPRLAGALDAVALLHIQQNKLAEAEPLIREAMDIDAKLPPSHPQRAIDLRVMGVLRSDQHKFDEAEQMFVESLEIRRRTLPAGHPLIAEGLRTLGIELSRRDKLAEAEALLRDAIEIDRKALPSDHPSTAQDLLTLADILEFTNPDESEHLYREALAMRRRILPANHRDIAQAMEALAGLLAWARLETKNSKSETEQMLRDALAIDRATLPPGHPQTGYCLYSVALFTMNAGKMQEAEPLYEEARKILEQTLPADDPDIAMVLEAVASNRRRQSKNKEAEPLLREALRMCRKSLPPRHPRLCIAATCLANLLTAEGQFKEAEPLFKEALPFARQTAKAGDGDIHHTIAGYALMLAEANRQAECEPLLRELLEVHRGAASPSSLRVTWDLFTLGAVLANQHRDPEAETFFREALATSKADPEHGFESAAAANLAIFLDKTARHEEATSLRQQYKDVPLPTPDELKKPMWAGVIVPL